MAARERRPLAPIQRSIVVAWEPATAFRHFTAEIGSWWPLRTHSVCNEAAVSVEFEARVGGRILERDRHGGLHEWGRVLAWQPPHRVQFQWYPGRDPVAATVVDVRFTAHQGGTRVELTHSGWERLGALARKARLGYPLGWAYMLRLYAGRRGPLVVTVEILGSVAGRLARRKQSGASLQARRP